MNKYAITIQNASAADIVPEIAAFQCWVAAALTGKVDRAELCIRIVDKIESQTLNAQYRQMDKPTNVLSFPLDVPIDVEQTVRYLGDLVVCAPVLSHEAISQGKPLMMHWAHMVIHGTLHLLGYDHIKDTEAEIMEAIEVELMEQLGFPDPYLVKED